MAGRVPLLNSEAQSNVDLNNLTPQNIGVATTRYKVKEVSDSSYTLTAQDVNSVIKLTYAGQTTVSLPDNIYSSPGEEIILWNTGGFRLSLSPSGNITLVMPSQDRYDGKPTKLTFLGINGITKYYSFNNPGPYNI